MPDQRLVPECPRCGVPGQSVPMETVRSLVQDSLEADYFLCCNPACQAAYYSDDGKVIFKEDVKVPIWFKEQDDSVPICYCANLTRGEIKEAVRKGYTSIAEIRTVTGKTQTGHCRYKNPSGRCCHGAFQDVIRAEMAKKG